MTTYEVRMNDRTQNTGLDCQYFATRDEAEQAASVVNGMHADAWAEVCESDQDPTITFAEWNERGW